MTQSSHLPQARRGGGPAGGPASGPAGGAADGGTIAVLGGLLVLLLSLLAGSAEANDIVTWTDDQGVTHFGNARLAPATARRVQVAPANGMETPVAPATRNTSDGPAMILIERPANRETIGWRGHDWNVKRRGHR